MRGRSRSSVKLQIEKTFLAFLFWVVGLVFIGGLFWGIFCCCCWAFLGGLVGVGFFVCFGFQLESDSLHFSFNFQQMVQRYPQTSQTKFSSFQLLQSFRKLCTSVSLLLLSIFTHSFVSVYGVKLLVKVAHFKIVAQVL